MVSNCVRVKLGFPALVALARLFSDANANGPRRVLPQTPSARKIE
jgi:hypothetical protein